MANVMSPASIRLNVLGSRVDRTTAVLPATTTQNLFAVTGRVILRGIVGQLTVATSATATNLKIQGAPTSGTAVDLCTNTAVASKEAGSWFGLTGTSTDALVVSNAGAGLFFDASGIALSPGFVRIITDGTNTGSVRWTALYMALDDNATLVAV